MTIPDRICDILTFLKYVIKYTRTESSLKPQECLMKCLKKQDVIDKLDALRKKKQGWKGGWAFSTYFATYLESIDTSKSDQYDFTDITHHLPQLALDAFEEMRTSPKQAAVDARRRYEEEIGRPVPNVTTLGASYLLDQTHAIQVHIGFLLKDITGNDYITERVDAYCNAELNLLKQRFDRFLRLVFSRGMFQIINNSTKRGIGGTFGETELRTMVMAGRLMLTFARKIDKNLPGHYEKDGKVFSNEDSFSFLAEDDDPHALGAGIQSIDCNLVTALAMIEDVISGWPKDEKAQLEVFVPNENLSIG